MNANHSSAEPTYEYQPTIIESRVLIRRLAIQITFFKNELKRSWPEFKRDPVSVTTRSIQELFSILKRFLRTPNVLYAGTASMLAITCIVIFGFFVQSTNVGEDQTENTNVSPVELVLLDVAPRPDSPDRGGTGGRSLSKSPKPANGVSGGGDRNPIPPNFGKLPSPSLIPAPIPTTPPVNPPALPVAGIDIDPALWKDVEARVYGDPESKSQTLSNGPGDGGGIGTGKGAGIGPGFGTGGGPGCGPPKNIGGQDVGGCTGDYARGVREASQVEQRARLLFKPEPQYTEEARRNQTTGTVMLRVVFTSSGEVDQIRAVRTLPFGLTERAIAAARQIKFVPAMEGGQPVSVQMQLEYNFNLY